jgi:hypothetical protein
MYISLQTYRYQRQDSGKFSFFFFFLRSRGVSLSQGLSGYSAKIPAKNIIWYILLEMWSLNVSKERQHSITHVGDFCYEESQRTLHRFIQLAKTLFFCEAGFILHAEIFFEYLSKVTLLLNSISISIWGNFYWSLFTENKFALDTSFSFRVYRFR